ncbi:hypothetical protein BH10BAC2_BH10BAC2_21670 [soil metagenome]
MIINLMHGTRKISATVLYNFNQLSNIIILRCDTEIIFNNKDIVLIYDAVSDSWTDIDGLQNNDPVFFRELTLKLKNILLEAKKASEKSLQFLN